MQLDERSPGETGTGHHRVTGETAGQEIEADAGGLATSMVPPSMENPAQEIMPPDEQETGLAGESEVAVGTVPPAVAENAEKITPDQESSELPVDKEKMVEQKI